MNMIYTRELEVVNAVQCFVMVREHLVEW